MKTRLVWSALQQVPKENQWGIVIYFFATPEGTLKHKFAGSFFDYDETTQDIREYLDEGATFNTVRAEITHMLKNDQGFKSAFDVEFFQHEELKTDWVRIALKMG